MKSSIAIKLIFTIALTFGLIVAYFGLWWHPNQEEYSKRTLIVSTRDQLFTAAEAIKPYVLQNQLAALYEVLGTLLVHNRNWIELELYDDEGARLFPLETGAPISGRPHMVTLHQGISYRDEQIGRLRLIVDFGAEMERLHARHVHLLWTIIAAIGTFVLVLMLMLQRWIRHPLEGLVKAANELAGGNFESLLPQAREDEIGGLIKDFSAMRSRIKEHQHLLERSKEAAEAANHAKSVFLAHMSHELRTPLNSILGFAQVLLRSRHHPLTEKQKQQVGWITGAGQHLLELIDEVLDLAKIESGELQLSIEDVSAKPLLEECIRLSQTLADNRGVKLTLNQPSTLPEQPCCRSDYRRIKQAVLNLLSNAVKYNRAGGRATLEYRCTDEGRFRILVTDDGPGIPKRLQSDLFKPFNRLGAEASEVEGTGIGLLLTKRIIESMDGRVGFESEEGRGSTFWIELPQGECKEACSVHVTEPKIRKSEKGPREWRVLYVEDNPANLSLMEDILEEVAEVRLMAATTAERGLELAKTEPPDLIVMDINLPGMSGVEALRHLQEIPECRSIPVIALSADAMRGAREQALEHGFLEYLTKPVDVERLMEVMENVLRPGM